MLPKHVIHFEPNTYILGNIDIAKNYHSHFADENPNTQRWERYVKINIKCMPAMNNLQTASWTFCSDPPLLQHKNLS